MEILCTAGVLALFMAALYAASHFFAGAKRRVWLIYAALGVASLFAVRALGASVGVNLWTIAISALLGVPGTALLWLIGLVL